MNWLIYLAVIPLNLIIFVVCENHTYNYQVSETYEVNILLLLPINNTYKFSVGKVLPALLMAVDELKTIDYGSSFRIKIVSDVCDCSGITAPVNAMENIYGKRNHSLRFQAVFGPMCD